VSPLPLVRGPHRERDRGSRALRVQPLLDKLQGHKHQHRLRARVRRRTRRVGSEATESSVCICVWQSLRGHQKATHASQFLATNGFNGHQGIAEPAQTPTPAPPGWQRAYAVLGAMLGAMLGATLGATLGALDQCQQP